MNNIEKIEEAIEEKMDVIGAYKGIKRSNSYFMFAQFFERYVEKCIECGNMYSE
jgi:hypothetical protein